MTLTDAQVISAFGDPTPYIRPDGSLDDAWRTAQLAYYTLPAPLPLAGGHPGQMVTRLLVHRRLVPFFAQALEEIHADAEAWASLGDTAGAFCWRLQRNAKKRSRHGWGICLDVDVADNPQYSDGKVHPKVRAAFERAGFQWGGSWAEDRRDPMHWEFVAIARLAPITPLPVRPAQPVRAAA